MIVVLAVIGAIVVVAVRDVTGNTRDDACATEGKAVRTAIAAYRAAHGATADPTRPQLVDDGDLDASARRWDVTYEVHVPTLRPAPGSSCTGTA